MQRTRRLDGSAQHGAAAVELALVLPLLVLLIGGIIDFGFALNAQVGLAHAAREGVRVEALQTGDPVATAAAAFFGIAVTEVTPTLARACPSDGGAMVRMQATYDPFFPLPVGPFVLRSEAVMRCNG
jgi:Flp pilus assembly protein TadG